VLAKQHCELKRRGRAMVHRITDINKTPVGRVEEFHTPRGLE
jgi:hypothetical protein